MRGIVRFWPGLLHLDSSQAYAFKSSALGLRGYPGLPFFSHSLARCPLAMQTQHLLSCFSRSRCWKVRWLSSRYWLAGREVDVRLTSALCTSSSCPGSSRVTWSPSSPPSTATFLTSTALPLRKVEVEVELDEEGFE